MHGIATQEQRERRLAQIGEAAPKDIAGMSSQTCKNSGRLNNLGQDQDDYDNFSEDDEELPSMQPQEHHHISPSVRHKIQLSSWLGENQDDPALKVRMYPHYRSNR